MAWEDALRALHSARDSKHLPSATTSQASVKQRGEVPTVAQAQFSAAPAEPGMRLLPVGSLTVQQEQQASDFLLPLAP